MITRDQDIAKLQAEFGDNAFSGNDVAKVLGTNPHGTGGIFKYMTRQGLIRRIRSGAYQFVAQDTAPIVTPQPEPQAQPVLQTLGSRASVVKIGPLYIPETVNWLADTLDAGRITLHTAILEIEPNTKHVRNKRIVFRKDSEPREYTQLVAWLDSLSGDPPHIDDTALELAADLEKQLNAAKQEIAELNRKLDAIRGAL